MERLTYDFCVMNAHCWWVKGADNLECREVCENQEDQGCKKCPIAKAFDRLAEIENILGDEYDLDHLRELIESDRDGRLIELPRKAENEIYVELDMFDYWPEDLIPQKVLDAMRDNFREIHRLPLLGITSLPAEEVQAKLKEAESE